MTSKTGRARPQSGLLVDSIALRRNEAIAPPPPILSRFFQTMKLPPISDLIQNSSVFSDLLDLADHPFLLYILSLGPPTYVVLGWIFHSF